MTPRRGVTGDRRNLSPAIPRESGPVPGDRNHDHSYPPGRSTYVTPAQRQESIDVTGDPGDRTAISTTRDVREEKTHTQNAPCNPMCPHSNHEFFRAHPVEGRNLPPDHPDPPAHRCIHAADLPIKPATRQNLSPGGPCASPGEPEPVGPIAENLLDRLAAQPADDALTQRRRAALGRLGRANTTNPLVRRTKP